MAFVNATHARRSPWIKSFQVSVRIGMTWPYVVILYHCHRVLQDASLYGVAVLTTQSDLTSVWFYFWLKSCVCAVSVCVLKRARCIVKMCVIFPHYTIVIFVCSGGVMWHRWRLVEMVESYHRFVIMRRNQWNVAALCRNCPTSILRSTIIKHTLFFFFIYFFLPWERMCVEDESDEAKEMAKKKKLWKITTKHTSSEYMCICCMLGSILDQRRRRSGGDTEKLANRQMQKESRTL